MKRLLFKTALPAIINLVLFVLIFDLGSCRKATDVTPVNLQEQSGQSTSINLKDARQWLNGYIITENGRGNSTGGVYGQPQWEDNTTYEFKNGLQILRIDMPSDGLEPYGYREMVFFRDSTGQIQARIMEVVGFPDYMVRKQKEKGTDKRPKEYIDSHDFSGDIYIYNLQHTFLKGRRYENTVLKNELLPETRHVSTERKAPVMEPLPDATMGGSGGGGWGTAITLPTFEVKAPAYHDPFSDWTTNGTIYRPIVPSELPTGNHSNADYDMPIGGGGRGNSKGNINPNAPYVVAAATDKIIANIKEYTKCFSLSQGAKLTICVDQPIPGTRQTHKGTEVGHTFIILEQTVNGQLIRRSLGFYPSQGVYPIVRPTANAVLVQDENHVYNVSLSVNVNAQQLQSILAITNYHKGTYDLSNYNCTNFGIDIAKAAGINAPLTKGSWPGGSGCNPGDFGEDLRMISGATTRKDSSPTNTGHCK